MKRIALIFSCVALLFFIGCKEKPGVEEAASLDLVFHASFDGEVLTMLEKESMEDLTLRYLTSDFYVSDIELISDEGRVLLSDIEFIDFSNVNTTIEQSLEGISIEYQDLDLASFHTISFGLGVNAENNSKSPVDFTSDNILSSAALHWPAWSSYIFMRIEGKFDTDVDGDFNDGYVFHVGTDANYATVELPIDLVLEEGNNTLDLYLDHKKLFELAGGGYFDIPANPLNHQPDLPGIINIARNMPNAWSAE